MWDISAYGMPLAFSLLSLTPFIHISPVSFPSCSDNYLSGGIPEELFDDCIQLPWPTSTASCSLTSTILYLFLHQNFLSSSIPPSIGGARGDQGTSYVYYPFSLSFPAILLSSFLSALTVGNDVVILSYLMLLLLILSIYLL